jgi:hypothetical protein
MDSAAYAAWAMVFVTAIGLTFVGWQVRQAERNIRASTSERLSAQSFDVIRFLAQYPESHDYFYGGKPLDKSEPNYRFMLYAAEILTNYIENVVAQLPNMDDELKVRWKCFVEDTYKMSPAVQGHLREFGRWYDARLIKLLKDAGVWVA